MTKIAARRAAVRPRVHVPGSTVAHLLEEVVRETLRTHFEGVIEIIGGPGMGKTTALEHLAEVLTDEELANVMLFDEPHYDEIRDLAHGRVLICTQKGSLMTEAILSVKLIGWSEDDAIEYLLAKHHDRCGSVMTRLEMFEENQIEYHLLVGCPQTISLVLDRMAQDESLISVKQCVRDAVSELLPDAKVRELCGHYSLCSLMQGDVRLHKAGKKLHNHSAWKELNKQTNQLPQKLFRHKYIQRMLAAEELIRVISNNKKCHLQEPKQQLRLIFEAARLIELDSPAEVNLKNMLASHAAKLFGFQKMHALAASLLHSTGRGWRPGRDPIPDLRGAILHGIQLSEEDLTDFDLSEAVLCDANLVHSKLDRARLFRTNFDDANLSHASLNKVNAARANFHNAKMQHLLGHRSTWKLADFTSASLENSRIINSSFQGANLTNTNFTAASLKGSVFVDANINGTIFTNANLNSAKMQGLDLILCILTDARFDSANLSGCHLEGVNLPGANFQNANLTNTYWTDSVMPGTKFQNAILRGAGLAGIEWEGANLSGADLRESTFHMGSSRSGLVDSFLASEGTRTGFYTDDYDEQYYKSPEEIRKANLRGADLRGANITGVDFYLVDLRDAQIDDEQRAQLETTGAILFDRE